MSTDRSFLPQEQGSLQSSAPVHRGRLPLQLFTNKAFLLSRLGGEARRRYAQALTAWELNPTHHNVMSYLEEVGEASQQQLVQALSIDRANMFDLLNRLEQRDLVERAPDPHDKRRHVVRLTLSGSAMMSQIRVAIDGLNQDLFAGLDEQEQQTLHTLLLKLLGLLTETE